MKNYVIGDYISEHEVFLHLIRNDIDVLWLCNGLRCKGNRSCELGLPEDMTCRHTTDCDFAESVINEKQKLYFQVISINDGRIKVEEVKYPPVSDRSDI